MAPGVSFWPCIGLIAISLVCAAAGLVRLVAYEPPDWDELTAAQHSVLAPVAAHWDRLGIRQRQRLLTLVNERYAKLPEEARRRIAERLPYWTSLGREERARARVNYVRFMMASELERADLKRAWCLEKDQRVC